MDLQLIIIVTLLVLVALAITARIVRHRTKSLLTTFIGILIGLVVGALLSLPLASLPSPYSEYLPITVTLLAAIMFGTLFAARGAAFVGFLYQAITGRGPAAPHARTVVVDTSAIIDGRVGEIAKTGFLFGTLLVHRIVLEELQNIADSSEPLRRGKGRRGLEVLAELEQNKDVQIEIVETPLRGKAVDAKLVQLAKQRRAAIMTTDYNLNRVAEIERVTVLNVNELSNALRPPVLPGEELVVHVVDKGREKGQGVGYLPDGTMIVVERGDKLVGQEVRTTVSRSLQTVAGKMVFVTPKSRKTTHRSSK